MLLLYSLLFPTLLRPSLRRVFSSMKRSISFTDEVKQRRDEENKEKDGRGGEEGREEEEDDDDDDNDNNSVGSFMRPWSASHGTPNNAGPPRDVPRIQQQPTAPSATASAVAAASSSSSSSSFSSSSSSAAAATVVVAASKPESAPGQGAYSQ